MPSPRNINQNRPPLFSPSVNRRAVENDYSSVPVQEYTLSTMSGTALENTSSFRYDLQANGLKSTQQLNIDWSTFESHTFFASAQVKTNVAFRKIFDQFPFDGTQGEVEAFLDSLTGFEKYIYDLFPKNKGYLAFSGSLPGDAAETGTYVIVKDIEGAAYPGVSRQSTGLSLLNPENKSMTIEFQVYLPQIANSASFVMNKFVETVASGTHGFGVLLEATGSTAEAKLVFKASSGSYSTSTDALISKGAWNHIAFVWDRQTQGHQITSHINGVQYSSSSQLEIGLMNMDAADLTIGSGSAVSFFTPLTTFSGSIDELRIWHKIRSQSERDESQRKNVFAQPNLKLYFKFNEASGSQTPIVLDHSGNSLHGTLSPWAFNRNIREISTGSLAGPTPMLLEKESYNPVLFPLHVDIEELNDYFLSLAEEFDRVNPNRIDRLIPKHYLLIGQDKDGLESEEGNIINALTSQATPDTTKLGDTQVILMLLYTWAKFFDEMKLYIQSMGDLIHLDYDSIDTIPDSFLKLLADKSGITLPALFTGSSLNQFINAENIDDEISTNTYSLQYIQNQIWRRVLLNLQDVLKSKGTIHSVKTYIRSVGIEPDNNFRIREFGGPSVKALANTRENKSEVSTLVNFSGSALVQSPFLIGPRLQTEIGFPYFPPGTTFTNGIANQTDVGLFTSGSWSFEGVYRFLSAPVNATQSLARLHSTGSAAPVNGFLHANLIATSDGLIRLVATPGPSSSIELQLSASVFDGNVWHVSFGRQRADEIGSNVSSSYFLRAARQDFGEVLASQVTSSYVNEAASIIWQTTNAITNSSGSFLSIGTTIINSGSTALNSGSFSSFYRSSEFEGRAGHFRFWSKALSETEWVEHVRNFKSLGVSNPLANFNFNTNQTGSFGRLRLDVTTDQQELSSDGLGQLDLLDFSQNGFNLTGSFPANTGVVLPQRFQYSLLSPKFDVGSTTDKVRVRSFQQFENTLNSPYSQVGPIYALEPSEAPTDNTRFTIDFSVVDALDQDMINLFSTLDIFDNIIGNPELVFSPDYPGLDNLRNIYFNRLTDRVNLKGFFEFYKWFDTNLGTFIAQLLPRKTKFLGTNFVIESHMLERAKMEYQYSEIYLGDGTRHALKDTILFQQFTALLARY